MADDEQEQYRPIVEYEAIRNYAEQLDGMASVLDGMGGHAEAERLRARKSNLDSTIPAFLHSISASTASRAKAVEKVMVGHGRSGYVPTGNLMRSIDVHDSGFVSKIYPSAKAKDGKTEYGGFVEYGTRLHPIPEPFMQTAWKAMANDVEKELQRFNGAVNRR